MRKVAGTRVHYSRREEVNKIPKKTKGNRDKINKSPRKIDDW